MCVYSGPDDTSIYVDANTRIQVLETMMDLPTADKEQSAAFIVSSTSVSLLVFYQAEARRAFGHPVVN